MKKNYTNIHFYFIALPFENYFFAHPIDTTKKQF